MVTNGLTTCREAGRGFLVPVLWFLLALAPAAVQAQGDVPIVRFQVERFTVEGENPLGADETRALLDPYVGDHEGLEGLLAAADALEAAIRAAGYAFHRVSLPPQTMAGGVVRLGVVVFRIGKVEVAGNEHFDDENVRRSVPGLTSGDAPNTRALTREVTLANEHPSKNVSLSFSESVDVPGEIDVAIEARDQKPWSIFASTDNTGNDETGRWRVSAGFQITNLWNRDHIFSFSYTTSPTQLRDVSQFGFVYRLPVYRWNSTFSALYTDSDVNSGQVGDTEITGAGEVWGLRWDYNLERVGSYEHGLSLDYQNRLFDNRFAQLFALPLQRTVRSTPLTLEYGGRYTHPRGQLTFAIGAARNLELGSENDREAYRDQAFNAEPDWSALRGRVNYDHFLPSAWMLRTALSFQRSGEALIPGEQFGLGGARSVRGYLERVVSGDNGYRASVELWTPPVKRLGGMRFLAFLEGGHVEFVDRLAIPGFPSSASLSSIGAGLRYGWRENLSVVFDVASTLTEGGFEGQGEGRAHLSVFVRY